jgi:hypothetical protein
MQSNTIRIIAAVVDTHNLTLYKEDGETLLIPQGDPRVRTIVDQAVPLILSQGYADIDITPAADNSYVEFESMTKGAVKLFRIAKSKLLSLMGVEEDPPKVVPMSIGTIPTTQPAKTTQVISVVEEILQHAVPVTAPEFHEEGIAKQGNVVEENGETIKAHSKDEATDTIIAVTEGKIIPGMEKIKTQFSRAAKLGSTTGVENFLRRLGSVIETRSHSVEDLLKFMERGDLPIAEDGSILIYKVLNRVGGGFTDCHTGRVKQWVGSYVCMDPSLVDHNRSNECSNGLHVARRGYVKEFSGSACVLAKLAPEDVIAVPSYDANKMRVCGYHIIAELTQAQYTLLNKNKPITDDPEGKVLLGKALAGQHIGKTHEVRITAHMGRDVQTTKLDETKKVKAKEKAPVAEALTNPDAPQKDEVLDPKAVAGKVEQLSRKDMAATLYADYQAKKEGALEALLTYKKTAKVSWEKLGIPAPDEMPKVIVEGKAVPVEVVVAAKPVSKKPKAPDTKRTVNDVVLGEGSPKERIQKLLAIGLTSVGVAKAVLELKKKSKKSWPVLGVSDTQVEQITKLAE